MNTNNEQVTQAAEEQAPVMTYQHRCGFCDSTQPLIPYEQMYGPGAFGYDCCPDCGGV